MAGIIMDSIRFENYRQYGTGVMKFNHDGDHMLSILVAKNGTGKTTFLNSITWCLYQEEFQLSNKSKALPIVNTKTISETEEGSQLPVSVAITIIDNDRVVEFTRKQNFIVIINDKGVKTVTPGPSELSVSITNKGDFSNSEIKVGPDAELTVTQYFDKDIYDFYFFDGENLKEFFAPGRELDIKRSINNISQVSLLENVCEHVKKIKDAKTRKLGKEAPDIEKLYMQQEEKEEERRSAEAIVADREKAIKKNKEELEKIDEILKKYGPINQLAEERVTLEKTEKELDEEWKGFYADRSAFVRRYAMLLKMYPSMKKVLDYIDGKEVEGELPPSIDIDQVRFLLDNLDQPCPLCDHRIEESGRQHLERLLKQYSVSSKTSNFLKEIKGPLEGMVKEAQQYKEKRKFFSVKEADLQARQKTISTRLKEINKLLINYKEDGKEKINVSLLEGQRKNLEDDIANKNQLIGAAKRDITKCDEELEKIAGNIEAVGAKLSEYKDLQAELKVLSIMEDSYKKILSKITGGMRTEIEDTTRSIFESMNWKINTFGDLEIDDDYTLSIYEKTGLEMTGSLSATEQMAMAYAFILAIHQASGRNCPLVIDSPIGRSSDQNREDIANALLEVSGNKQIIMLFTPDDYTLPVQKMYDSYADVRNLTLTKDEKFIEGIGI